MSGAHLDLGNVFHIRGEIDSAEAAYRRELALEPADAQALVNLADVLIERDQEQVAIRLYGQALETGGLGAGWLLDRARTVRDAVLARMTPSAWPQCRNGLPAASAMLRAIIENEDLSIGPDVPIDLDEIELHLGRFDRVGVPSLRRLAALQTDPKRTIAGLDSTWRAAPAEIERCRPLDEFYHHTGHTHLALPLWRALLRLGCIEPGWLNDLAAAALRDGERSDPAGDATAIWTVILDEVPDVPFVLLNLGAAAMRQGDLARAQSLWERFLSIYPDRPEAGEVRARLASP